MPLPSPWPTFWRVNEHDLIFTFVQAFHVTRLWITQYEWKFSMIVNHLFNRVTPHNHNSRFNVLFKMQTLICREEMRSKMSAFYLRDVRLQVSDEQVEGLLDSAGVWHHVWSVSRAPPLFGELPAPLESQFHWKLATETVIFYTCWGMFNHAGSTAEVLCSWLFLHSDLLPLTLICVWL